MMGGRKYHRDGRYGLDAFGKCLAILGMLLIVIAAIAANKLSFWAGFGILLCGLWRTMSHNIEYRTEENEIFLKSIYQIKGYIWNEKKHRIKAAKGKNVECPNCHQLLGRESKKKNFLICPVCKEKIAK